MKRFIVTVAILCVFLIAAVSVFVESGVYNIGADSHHTKPVQALMQALRARSIEHHARDIKPPNLDDPQLILKGAGQYAAMCTGCHLKPGTTDSEIRPGLYPQPPNLSKVRIEPREAFWVIKHGIKMSAMPAWGGSHDDATIWSMVAFLQKLPELTPAQYKDIVARAPPDMDMDEDSGHGDADTPPDAHDGPAMQGMPAPAKPDVNDGTHNAADEDRQKPHQH
jgi:mono/diheme cytochrome c family protein